MRHPLTVISKKSSSLLFINHVMLCYTVNNSRNCHLCYLLTNALLYCEILFKARGLEVQTELARSLCKKRELSTSKYGMSNPVNK